MVLEEWTIIKEFETKVEGCPHPIRARVLQLKSRNPNKIYYGTVSHYYKPNEQAHSVAIPQGQGNSLAAVERDLTAYLKAFAPIGVVENDDFDCLIY
jgi:hypothetical protein